jgi:hypothetical protein
VCSRPEAYRGVNLCSMGGRTYRLEVEGELGEISDSVFGDMSVMYDHGNTVLVGPIRDQSELNGLVQRCSDLGLTLLSLNAVSRG